MAQPAYSPLVASPTSAVAPWRTARQIALTLGTAVALGALWWNVVHHPVRTDFFSLFFAPQHLVIAAVLGALITRLHATAAKAALVIAGGIVICGLFRVSVLVLFAAQVIAVYGAVALTPGRRALRAWATGIVLAAGLGACWFLRSSIPQAIGLWVWLVFKCISFAVDTQRGCPGSFLDYLAYVFFYPTVFGTIEVYEEFRENNLLRERRPDYRAAAIRLAVGFVRLTIAIWIPYSFNDVIAAKAFLAGWGIVLIVYLKTVLFVTGCFDAIVGVAHLYGCHIRENFPGVLLACSPREWWRSWRATMTHWLVRYVYIPLGGNRRHQVLNIAAVFAVSTVWHWIGFPFLGARQFYPAFVPVLVWGILNTVVIGAASQLGRRSAEDAIGMREAKILATVIFGCANVMLLAYTVPTAGHFADNVRVLILSARLW